MGFRACVCIRPRIGEAGEKSRFLKFPMQVSCSRRYWKSYRRSHLLAGIRYELDEIFGRNFFMIIQFIPWSHVSAPAAKCIDTIVQRDRIPIRSNTWRIYLLTSPMASRTFSSANGRILYASILLGIAVPIKNPTRLSWIHFASNRRLTKIHENRSIWVPPARSFADEMFPYRVFRCLFTIYVW